MSEIEKPILKTLGKKFERVAGETRQTYLRRLAQTFDKVVPDEDYEKLPERSQEWLDETNQDIKAQKKTVKDFADVDEEAVKAEFPEGDDNKSKAKAEKPKAGKKAPAKPAKKASKSDEDEDEEDEDKSDEDAAEGDDEEPKAKAGKKGSKKPAAKPAKKAPAKPAKKEKAKKEAKEHKPRASPMLEYVKLRMKSPKAARADLIAKMAAKGTPVAEGTALAMDNHTYRAIEAAKQLKLDFSKSE